MKIPLGVIGVSLSVWAAGCCGGPGVALVPAGHSESAALLEGGARAGYRVVGAGDALPAEMTLASSDPAIVEAAAQPDAKGVWGVTTGKGGKATLTLRDSGGAVLDTLDVSVKAAAKLGARFAEGATAGRAAANEVVGLRIVAEDAEGAPLFGSGRIKTSVGGVGEVVAGEASEGTDRVFFTGKQGQATVHAALGALALDATVAFFVPQIAATIPRSITETNCPVGDRCDTQSTSEVSITVNDDDQRPLAGGRCAWRVTGGATLVSDDSGIDAVELRATGRTAWFNVPVAAGVRATATCLLGGKTATVTLR